MQVAFVQFNPQFGRTTENLKRAEDLIRSAKADLYVLPELCFSGYTFTSKSESFDLSETVEKGPTVIAMRRLSNVLNSAIVFGFPERDKESLYNSCLFVSPDGGFHLYRKLHLFLHEKDWFSPGNGGLKIVDFRGCRIGLMICFDWRFPEVARTLALKGAHVICHPANLVLPHCQGAMVTRCLENRVFAITANRTGSEKRGELENYFTGRSQIVDPEGRLLISATGDKDKIGVADINYRESEEKAINPKNNLWDDRRPEYY
jgi:predicted amidohydrolase